MFYSYMYTSGYHFLSTDLPSLYAVDRKRSMVQVHEQLKTLIEDALAKPAVSYSGAFLLMY